MVKHEERKRNWFKNKRIHGFPFLTTKKMERSYPFSNISNHT